MAATSEQQSGNGNGRGQDVAVFKPPRLPWHPQIEEKFGEIGVTKETWKALVEAVFPLAQTNDSVVMALSYCKARRLDPFKRCIHIVPMWNAAAGKMLDTVWPGIAELRTTAFRTKQIAGFDPPEFGEEITQSFTGSVGKRGQEREVTVDVTFPEYCSITVYRMVKGERVAYPGPRVWWVETYGRQGRSIVPNDMWEKRPRGMLEKCAEAAALRRAFPEEIGNELTADEMYGQEQRPMYDITPVAEPGQAAQKPSANGAQSQTPAEAPEQASAPAESQDEGTGEEPWVVYDWHGEEKEAGDESTATNMFNSFLQGERTKDELEALWEVNQHLVERLQAMGKGLRVRQLTDAYEKGIAAHNAREASCQPAEPEEKPQPKPKKKAEAKKDPPEVTLYDADEAPVAKFMKLKAWGDALHEEIQESSEPLTVVGANFKGYQVWAEFDPKGAEGIWQEANDLANAAAN